MYAKYGIIKSSLARVGRCEGVSRVYVAVVWEGGVCVHFSCIDV